MYLFTRVATLSAFMALSISAATISFHSDGLSEGNDQSVANVIIPIPHSVWAVDPGSSWISFTNTGVGGTVLPNNSATPFARFWESFTLPNSPAYSGTINVWADDTANVYLNNQLIGPAAPAQGANCASTAPGCIQTLGGHYTLLGSILHAGENILRIEAYQRDGDVAGVLYSGTIETAGRSITATPEPATYGLIGASLAALGLLRSRRRQ